VPGALTIPSPLGELMLRPEREDDAGFRYALFKRSRPPEWELAPFPPELLEQLMSHQFQAQTSSYLDQFPDGRFDIIELNSKPIGRIVVDRPGDQLHLIDLAIAPEMRGQGLGAAIMRSLMDEATAAGVPVTLEVGSSNDPSMRLYERLGFTVAGEEPMYLAMEWRPEVDVR
jgi:ribosomal protein S18 acetylase RimI-like enzyme